MRLTDFFTPLNPLNLFYFLLLAIYFDALGHLLNKLLIKSSAEYRSLQWIFGMALFVLIWFILGLFIVPNAKNILISIIVSTPIFLPGYIKNIKRQDIIRFFKALALPLILITPLLPAIWVKSSLPPYQWDELAYHYTSPWAFGHISTSKLTGGFYENIPRTYDVLYALIFNLTKTYSIARLFHFLTFFSTAVFSFHWLKKNYGLISAIVFILISFYIPGSILHQATSGYVDIASNSFVFLGIIATIEFIQKKTSLVVATVFWALALGTRYNSLIPLLSYFFVVILIYLFTKKISFSLRTIISGLLTFAMFGGFWYLKNLFLTGNPIYPFLLPCYRFAETCQAMKGYFTSTNWTYAIDFKTFPTIVYFILSGNKSLAVIFGIGLLLITQLKGKSKFVPWVVLAALSLDFILIKYSSGYMPRYYLYMQTVVFFLVSLILGRNDFVHRRYSAIKILLVIATSFFLIKQVPKSILSFYRPDKLNPHETNFALGKENIYDWTAYLFPRTAGIIKWCARPEIISDVPITFYDPDITWFEFEGRFNGYLHKCVIVPTPINTNYPDKVVSELVREKKTFNIVSLTGCQTGPLRKMNPSETDAGLVLRYINNKIICNSQSTEIPNLYFFDWEKVKSK